MAGEENEPDEVRAISDYFRQIFLANPKLVESRSNDKVYEIWLKDHPGIDEVPKLVMQILSNVKVEMRSALRKKRS